MNDEVSLATSMYQICGILEKFTGLRLSGAYSIDKDRDKTSTNDNTVDRSLEVAFATFQRFSADFMRTHLLQMGRAHTTESDQGLILSEVIKRVNSSWFDRDRIIEFGGGMGGGFQLYCDSQLVLTWGGGCGGGMFFDGVAKYVSLGGGCGSGIQIANTMDHTNKSTFYSFGGGGGCGTCIGDTSNSSSDVLSSSEGLVSQVVCGDALDYNATPLGEFRNIVHIQYTHSHFHQLCKRVTVSGGGGGGGGYMNGTSGAVSGSGFGYSFHLSSSTDDHHHRRKHGNNERTDAGEVRRVSREEFQELVASERDGTAAGNSQQVTPFESFSLLVQDSVTHCQGAGDWACICDAIQQKLSYCARIDNRSVSSSMDRQNSISSAVADTRVLNCDEINQYNATFASMLRNSCMYSRYPGYDNTDTENATANATDYRSDVCSGNLSSPLFSVHTTLGTGTPLTIDMYARNGTSSAAYLEQLASQQRISVSESARISALVPLMMEISFPSLGYQQSNAFILFELFAACTIVFMMVVAWLKVFGVHVRHRYVRIPDPPDHV